MQPSTRYMELVNRHFGGMKEAAFHHFFYWNNPFKLKHWTMNVVELLMIAGAVMGLFHAHAMYTQFSDPTYLGVWFASVIFIFVLEVPYYFPQLLGKEKSRVLFIHNEFTCGMVFNQTPLYIVALYPAMHYLAYVFAREAGLFEGTWGVLYGAVGAAFIHHIFYQIFDQLGPQFGWWLWDYEGPGGSVRLKSVPLYSIFNYSFLGTFSFVLLAHGTLGWYVQSTSGSQGEAWSVWVLAGLTLLVGTLCTPFYALVNRVHWFFCTVGGRSHRRIKITDYGVLLAAAALTCVGFWCNTTDSIVVYSASLGFTSYAPLYGVIYLVTFAWMWFVALREFPHVEDGLTRRGTPIGSVPYTVACFCACLYIVLMSAK